LEKNSLEVFIIIKKVKIVTIAYKMKGCSRFFTSVFWILPNSMIVTSVFSGGEISQFGELLFRK